VGALGAGGGLPAANAVPAVPGHGLRGMRERVTSHGGSLEAGPQDGGGFRLRAVLPWEERSEAESPESLASPESAPERTEENA